MKNIAITLVLSNEETIVNIKMWRDLLEARQVDQVGGKNTDQGDSTNETNQQDDLTGRGDCDKAL